LQERLWVKKERVVQAEDHQVFWLRVAVAANADGTNAEPGAFQGQSLLSNQSALRGYAGNHGKSRDYLPDRYRDTGWECQKTRAVEPRPLRIN
jgi:hypothetical protein